MGLCFIFWSIAFVYISMLTSCLAPQNTPDLIQAWLAGNRHHNKQSDGFWKLRFPLLLYVRSSVQLSLFKMFFFHHTFLWFPNLTLMLICCMCTAKWLWTTGTIEQDDLLLKTQVNDLIKRRLIRNHCNNLLHNMHITGVFWPSSLVSRTSFSFFFKKKKIIITSLTSIYFCLTKTQVYLRKKNCKHSWQLGL